MPGKPPLTALEPRRILVRGVNWLGDAVMTTPALLRLREYFPQALIALVTPEKLRALWLNHPAVDEIIAFKQDEDPWQIARKVRILMWPEAAVRRNASAYEKRSARAPLLSLRGGFDLAIVLPNSPRSALEPWLARIPRRIGYARPWRKFLLTDNVADRSQIEKMRKRSVAEIKKLISVPSSASPFTFPDSAHQIHDYLHLVAALGANPEPLPPQLVVTSSEVKAAAQKFEIQQSSNRPVFGLNPGAEYGPAKRWPAERFIAAARQIQKRTNCRWLILGGKADAVLAKEIELAINQPSTVTNLAGQTSLRELCAVIKLCRLVLTNDTGPMHIAAALDVPVVVPFGSTSPELTGPIPTSNLRHQLLRSDAPCSPCFLRECPIDFRCMNGIFVERVVEAVLKLAN
jgi:heptosyltransferase-2